MNNNAQFSRLAHARIDTTFHQPSHNLWTQNVLSELLLLQQLERLERRSWIAQVRDISWRLKVSQIAKILHELRIIVELQDGKMLHI